MLLGALLGSGIALAWLALSMPAHWRQVRGAQPLARDTALALRMLGGLFLVLSLGLSFAASHPTIAPLVWVMALAAGALAVALTLAWWPRLLAPLLAWVGTDPPDGNREEIRPR